jgi:hypothetical protein
MTCCGDVFEEFTGRQVSTSALGGIGQLVLYHLSGLNRARDSHGLRIRRLGRGYPRTPQETRLPPESPEPGEGGVGKASGGLALVGHP